MSRADWYGTTPSLSGGMGRQSHHSNRRDTVTPYGLARLRPMWRHVGNRAHAYPMSHASANDATPSWVTPTGMTRLERIRSWKISFGRVHFSIFLKGPKYKKKTIYRLPAGYLTRRGQVHVQFLTHWCRIFTHPRVTRQVPGFQLIASFGLIHTRFHQPP
jgi:hypothetical protein